MTVASIKLGGRLYTIVNYEAITSLNEHYVSKLIREIGLDRKLPAPDDFPSPGEIEGAVDAGSMTREEADAIARQRAEADTATLLELETALADSLRLHELLGGYLLPLGKTEADFTLELARETAATLAGLQSREDRAEIHRLGLSVVADFFRDALASFETSEASLIQASAAPTTIDRSAAH